MERVTVGRAAQDPDAVLGAIAAEPPVVQDSVIAAALETRFGLAGTLYELVGERDQNFRLDGVDGRRYVVKVIGRAESASAVELQLAALRHLEAVAFPGVPHIVPTLAGDALGGVHDASGEYSLRVVTFVEGTPLSRVGVNPARATSLGRRLAELDRALAQLEFRGRNPVLLWDLQRAGELRSVVGHVEDPAARRLVSHAIDDFESRASPALAQLPAQIIHGDANPDNILIAEDRSSVAGLIDFGDMVMAPPIVDAAIAAAYLRATAEDPLGSIAPFIDGYRSVVPLDAAQLELLYDLARARLATTVTLLHWRLASRPPDDPYRLRTLAREYGAQAFLELLHAMGRGRFVRQLMTNQ